MTKTGSFWFGCCAVFALMALASCSNESGSPSATNVAPTKPVPTDPLSDARTVTDAYLQAVRIIEVPEGKAAVAANSWGGRFTAFAPRDLPSIKVASTLFDGLFDTDIPGVKGYRRLLQASIISAGQTDDEKIRGEAGTPAGAVKEGKYVAVAYMDAASKKWMVFALVPATDVAGEISKTREYIESHKLPSAEKAFYRIIAFYQILDGKFGDARMAIDSSKRLQYDSGSDYKKLTHKLQSLGASSAQISEAMAKFREQDRASAAHFEDILAQYEAFVSAVTAK